MIPGDSVSAYRATGASSRWSPISKDDTNKCIRKIIRVEKY